MHPVVTGLVKSPPTFSENYIYATNFQADINGNWHFSRGTFLNLYIRALPGLSLFFKESFFLKHRRDNLVMCGLADFLAVVDGRVRQQ